MDFYGMAEPTEDGDRLCDLVQGKMGKGKGGAERRRVARESSRCFYYVSAAAISSRVDDSTVAELPCSK